MASPSPFFDKSALLLMLTVLMIMMPTSVDGTLMEAPKFVLYGHALIVVSLFPRFDKEKLRIAGLCLILMVFFTIISRGYVSGITQFVPLLSLCLILSIDYKQVRIDEKVLSFWLVAFLTVLLGLGYLALFKVANVTSYLVKYYAFGYERLAENMYSRGKPILFFISHAIAAIAYTIIFFVTVFWGRYTKKSGFYLLAVLIIPLIVAQTSNTSYLSLFLIYLYVFLLLDKKYKVLYLVCTAVVLYSFRTNISELGLSVEFFMGNSNNGFLSRYDGERGVYGSSMRQIVDSPLVGTGLVFDEGQYSADSGPLNDLLRGGVFYFLLMRYLLYLTIFKCTKERKLAVMVVIAFLVMEIAYAFSLSLRGPVMMLLVVLYLSHIYQSNEESTPPRARLADLDRVRLDQPKPTPSRVAPGPVIEARSGSRNQHRSA